MASVFDQFVGLAGESTYGTLVAPASFYEFQSEGISGKYERIESEAVRAGTRVLRNDRWAPNPKGAEGDLKLEVLDKGFDLLLKHMLGAEALGTPAGGFQTNTYTVGDLKGKSLSTQIGRADNTGTIIPFHYKGGKVKGFELSNAVDGILNLSLDMDYAGELIGAGAGAQALATPTYIAGTQLFTFVGGAVTIGGTEFAVSDASIKAENGLKTDRYFLRGVNGTTKKEPLEEGLREYTFELKGEFEGVTHYNRVAASVAANAVAAITLTWDSPQGGQLLVTLPFGRFDEGPVNADGMKIVELNLSGKALTDGAASAITIAYKFPSP
jgi:hypothetical protein